MSESKNINTIKVIYQAVGRGVVTAIVAGLTEEVRWITNP